MNKTLLFHTCSFALYQFIKDIRVISNVVSIDFELITDQPKDSDIWIWLIQLEYQEPFSMGILLGKAYLTSKEFVVLDGKYQTFKKHLLASQTRKYSLRGLEVDNKKVVNPDKKYNFVL